MYGENHHITKGVNVVLNKELPPDTVKPKAFTGCFIDTVEVSEDVYNKLKDMGGYDLRGLRITNLDKGMDYGEYEVEICENCKHNRYFSYFSPATGRTEYDHECLKRAHGDYDVLECKEFERKKRFKVKRYDKYEAIMYDDNEMINEEKAVDLLNNYHETIQSHEQRISMLSELIDLADAIIDTSDNEKAKEVWENMNEKFEKKWDDMND